MTKQERQREYARKYRARHPDRAAAATKAWRDKNPDKVRRQIKKSCLRFQYDLTPAEYWKMFAFQLGRCAICRQPDTKALSVDHDHSTGVIRGLLCRKCNTGLGMFEDSTASLRGAIRYLEKKR